MKFEQTGEVVKSEFELRTERETLISSLPTRAPIYLPTEKIDLESQVVGLRAVSEIYADMERIYGPKLRALRNKYIGEDRAFIIGNGPSLNETDLSQLRDEVTFCVNGFFLKLPELDWTPTFYVVEDHLVAEDRRDAINALEGPTKLFPAYLGYCLDRSDDTIFYNHRPRKSYPDGFDFSTEADKITYTGCTVTMSCMQLAHYMGFRELYLIGVDASYEIPDDVETSEDYSTGVIDMKSDDTNHFHPDYFGKGFRWHDPQVNMMISAYEEAERVTRHLGRPIYNATLGGMLEVFERRDFHEIFPNAIPAQTFRDLDTNLTPDQRSVQVLKISKAHQAEVGRTAHSDFPKIAVIDMTQMGNGTATGELKQTLFDGYPQAHLLEVFSIGHEIGVKSKYLPGADGTQTIYEIEHALDFILDFDPDVVLFRPTPEKPNLTDLADLTYQHSNARFVTWIMDGWQDRLMKENPKKGRAADALLKNWFSRSAQCLAISEPMAEAFSKRYGAEFTAVSNGVDPKDWVLAKREVEISDAPFLLRYSGGLAPDMSLGTLRNIAQAVERLAAEFPIQFEINTRQHWIREQGSVFSEFENTHLSFEEMPIDEYRHWMMGGDACLIAYNFDTRSQTYVRYSLANKLPECLASGSALLAVGPKEVATIDFLRQHNLGKVVTKNGVDAVCQSLREMVKFPALREDLAQKGRDFAFTHKSVTGARTSFHQVLRRAAVVQTRQFKELTSKRKLRYLSDLEKKNKSKVAPQFSVVTEPLHPRPQERNTKGLPPSNESERFKMNFAKGRRNNVFSFYAGLKGVIAIILIGIASLPALPLTGWMSTAAKFGPAVAIAAMLLLVGRWVVQLTAAVERR